MFTMKKKQKLLIAATAALALVLVASLPNTYASVPSTTTTETQSSRTRMLIARGVAVDITRSQVALTRAGFALELKATEVNETIIKFDIVGGTIRINKTDYAIDYLMTGGNGAVIRDKHGCLLQATGTGPYGQSITLKLAGRYFWMWGHLYIARLAGSLQTESGKTHLLLRSMIRV
jgi:hypothetical protein